MSSNLIDVETALSFVEAQGYTCAKLDPLLESNTNSVMFGFDAESLGSWPTYFMGTVWMFGVYRISALLKTLKLSTSAAPVKKKNS